MVYRAWQTLRRGAAAWIVLAVLPAWAEVIPRHGPFCPSGYLADGNYCRSYRSDNPGGLLPRTGFCPSGYFATGDYCQPWSSAVMPKVIPKESARCPSGYVSDDTGRYCHKL